MGGTKQKIILEEDQMNFCYYNFTLFYVFGFYGAQTQYVSSNAETETMISAKHVCYKLQNNTRFKTTLPASAKRCIDPSYLNPFSRLLQVHWDERWLQLLCL
jgi:hypothetical protein